MSIREYDKDQLSKPRGVELAPSLPLQAPAQEDPLVFWTEHPSENTLVDLSGFRDGVDETSPQRTTWNGPYTGRLGLISQLAPAVEASLTGLAKKSVDALVISLRAWWRVLDAVENAAEQANHPMDRVEDVRQLTEAHRQWAYEHAMQPKSFRYFVAQANHVLALLRAPQLHWISPESVQPKRYLPPEKHLKVLRIALKQEWLKTHDRWCKADRLLSREVEATGEDIHLLRHYQHYEVRRQKIGKAVLTAEEIAGDRGKTSFTSRTGLSTRTMKDGFFPNRWDIDAAFCQCLAVTGWNPSTLFDLDATRRFLRTHPKDAKRFMLTSGEGCDGDSYELTGTKARARGAEQRLFGLWKTRFGAGYILNMLLERTAPMRVQLQQACDVEKASYAHMKEAGASTDALTAQFMNVQRLEAGCRSVWLYHSRTGIAWLGSSDMRGKIDGQGKQTHYLDALTQRLNAGRSDDDQIETLTSSDLRDAFALWVWRATGGNILAVMKALQHRWIQSTVRYVNNNIINSESNAQYRSFSNHLFGELGEGRLDVTILTHLCRYGQPTEEMMVRLDEYRALMRSRCKVACKDPHNPPKHIALTFVADGKRVCPTQRCLLCTQHAVFLPESVDGVAMRVEELSALEERMPMESWLTSLYQTELDNALIALKLFSAETVRQRRAYWAAAIAAGSHRVPGLALMNDGEEFTA